MRKKIESLLKDYQGKHSKFQIDNFIVGCSGDTWAQYKQALREIESRFEMVLVEKEKLIAAKKQLAALKGSANGDKAKRAAYGRYVRSYQKKLQSARDLKRELAAFYNYAIQLKEQIGDVDEVRRDELESESWARKGVKMVAIDLISQGRVSSQTFEFVLSLPKQSQLEIFKKIASQNPFAMLGFNPGEVEMITGKPGNNAGAEVRNFPRPHVR
jgi:hypothetical protein